VATTIWGQRRLLFGRRRKKSRRSRAMPIQVVKAHVFSRSSGSVSKCGKIESWDKELLERAFFSNRAKEPRLGVGFGNSWRCSYWIKTPLEHRCIIPSFVHKTREIQCHYYSKTKKYLTKPMTLTFPSDKDATSWLHPFIFC